MSPVIWWALGVGCARRAGLTSWRTVCPPRPYLAIAMKLSSQSWQELVDTLDLLILIADQNRNIQYANRAACALITQRSLGVEGERADLVLSELASLFDRADLLSGGQTSWRPMVIELPKTGSTLFHAKVARRAEHQDYVVVLQHITEELKAGLNPKRSVSALMPTFLHEIKNPLAAISTAVELLLEDNESGELHDELTAILHEVQRMKLVLDGAGLVGKPLRARSRTNIHYALRQACKVLQPLAKRKKINFNVFIAEGEPLYFDTVVLKAILFNLVMNAIHACNEGQSIKVTSVVERNTLLMEVKDNGIGMNQETLEQATRLFFTTKSFGSGIGLALCQEVAREAGGELRIESAEGVGTTVTFVVPIEPRSNSRV